MKRKYNRQQNNYMMAKALVDTLKAEAQKVEQAYMTAHGITGSDGEPLSHIWMIDDEAVFNRANEATAPEIDALGLCDAEQTLRAATDGLIEYGLSIIPAGMTEGDKLRNLCFGLNGEYVHIDVRQKVIDLVMKLDVATVRR